MFLFVIDNIHTARIMLTWTEQVQLISITVANRSPEMLRSSKHNMLHSVSLQNIYHFLLHVHFKVLFKIVSVLDVRFTSALLR